MKPFASVVLILASFCGAALAERPEATPFESFATRPSTLVAFAREIGSIESSDAVAKVSVLIVEDAANPLDRRRGVRFDLADNTGADQVYVEESRLARLKREVSWIDRFNPVVFQEGREAPVGVHVHGTESCWMPDPVERILCPSYRVAPDGTGLTLGAFGGPQFAFPGREAAELLALIERAIAELDRPE